MFKGYTIIAIFLVLMRLSLSKSNECDYTCDADGCKAYTNNSNTNISSVKYCVVKDIPNDVSFSVIEHETETSEFPALLQMNFTPPKEVCKYDITLLANASIGEKRCTNYKFQNFNGIETHTKATICFLSNDNQHQNSIGIFFPYIFTACYSVQFFFGINVKTIKGNKFLKTNYKRTEVMKPTFECTYKIVSDIEKNKKQVHVEASLSVPIVAAVIIYLGALYNLDGQEICFINKEDFANSFQRFNILDNYTQGTYHHFNTTILEKGKYKRDWKLQTDISQEGNYCFIISLYRDVRCKESSLWKPPVKRCSWYQSCQNVTLYKHVGIQPSPDVDTISHLYLPITLITLTIFAIIGFMYLIYVIHACNVQGRKFYKNLCNGETIKSNHTKCRRTNTCNSKDNRGKVKYKDVDVISTDIILLYPKGPETFMSLMADFRGIISRVCGCVVHDWYDRSEWNYVAEIGASDWFAEMLYKGSRVIWIDTPAMRSLITQRYKTDSFLKNPDEYSLVKIGDFRDVVFPAVFNLSMRNMEQSALNQCKHFIVRLRGFENFNNDNDPFVDLSPRIRYCIPQDLNLLCSDLSISESDLVIPFTNQEEELIKQHFPCVKFEFCK